MKKVIGRSTDKSTKICLDPFRVKPGRYKDSPIEIEGIFKSIKHRFSITASPEAWIALQNKCFGALDTYQYITKGLFKDLWSFINNAAYEARGGAKSDLGKRHFREALKIESALIYSCLMHVQKNKDKDDARYSKKKCYDIANQTQELILLIFGEEWTHLGLLKNSEKSFKKTYIDDGLKLLKGSKKTIANRLEILSSLFYYTKIKELKPYTTAPDEFELLWNITSVTIMLMKDPNTLFRNKKQKDIKDRLKQQIPILF